MTRVWELPLDWQKMPLSMNYRMHRMQENKIVQEVRSVTALWGRTLPRMGRCIVELEWYVRTRGKRDDENPAPTLKSLCDGLVDAGVVPGDTAEHMVKLMPRITYRHGAPASMVFRVAEIPPAFRPDSVQAVIDRINREEQTDGES